MQFGKSELTTDRSASEKESIWIKHERFTCRKPRSMLSFSDTGVIEGMKDGRISWKKAACLFLLGLVLFQPGTGMATFFQQYLTDAPLVVQRDERYQTDLYIYNKAKFAEKGCGPASVANAISIACGIQEQCLTDQIMRDIMRLMSGRMKPSEHPIGYQNLSRIADFDTKNYVGLGYVRNKYGNFWSVKGDRVDEEEIMVFFQSAADQHAQAFFASYVTLRGTWHEIALLARHLTEAGMEDAILTMCLLSSGTEGTEAPFRLGEGHYETMCLHAGEFTENGTLYLIDSCPRALPWEEKVRRVYYDTYFLDSEEVSLTETFEIRRVLPAILQLKIRDDLQLPEDAEIDPKTASEADIAAYIESEALEKLMFFGTGWMILTLPEL